MCWLYFLSVTALIYAGTLASSTIKYHVKYISFSLYCIFLACVTSLFCFINPRSSYNLVIVQKALKIFNFEWLFGVNITIKNGENIKNCKKPFVVVSNHQSAIDALIMIKSSPNGTAPLAKEILFYVPIFGQVCWLCGTIFINRKQGKVAIDIMRKVGQEMKKKLTSLWIFSEGTRHQLDEVMPFKKGAFHLAIQGEIPIVPVAISNYRNVIDTKNKLFDGGSIRVYCLPPITTVGLSSNDVDSLMEKVHKAISNTFNQDQREHLELYSHLMPVKK
ncbi:1-acyl-sn-glycerol-3-phosphate acyltransferase alpha [Hydra vulgaris]|uniref:1-acyl-sn-glycerol-3-phosphate acyltransferase n=1 Tax=Hydra vulgaris TaxID=6087 RepID=A0ABM4B7G1_HYDVU